MTNRRGKERGGNQRRRLGARGASTSSSTSSGSSTSPPPICRSAYEPAPPRRRRKTKQRRWARERRASVESGSSTSETSSEDSSSEGASSSASSSSSSFSSVRPSMVTAGTQTSPHPEQLLTMLAPLSPPPSSPLESPYQSPTPSPIRTPSPSPSPTPSPSPSPTPPPSPPPSPSQSPSFSPSSSPSPPRAGIKFKRSYRSESFRSPSPPGVASRRRRYRSRSPLRSVAVVKQRQSRSRTRSGSRMRSRHPSIPDQYRWPRSPVRGRTHRESQPPVPTWESSVAAEEYRRRHQITVATATDQSSVPPPVTSFRHAGLPEHTRRQMELRGYDAPTPVQAQAWPLAMSGRNLVMISNPGSGQTLAFLLPGVKHIFRNRMAGSLGGPAVLLLVPSRDAAIALHKTVTGFGFPGMRSACIAGPANRQSLVMGSLQLGCDLVVSTPGRLLDILNNNEAGGDEPLMDLHRCMYVVIDGLDRMLDIGLEGQMVRIIQHSRPDTQLVASSFAWSRPVQRMARKYMGDFTMVRVGVMANADVTTASVAGCLTIHQRVMVVHERSKLKRLKEELTTIYDDSDEPGKVLVFVQRKSCVDELVAFVRVFVHCNGIHSGRSPTERDDSMRQFRQGSCNILVATDLTSCGLDLAGIRYVINYDFPESLERYIRRLARIATISTSDCVSISFFTHENGRLARALLHHLAKNDQYVDPRLSEMVKAASGKGGGSGKSGEGSTSPPPLPLNVGEIEENRARRKRMRNRRRAQLRRLSRLRRSNR